MYLEDFFDLSRKIYSKNKILDKYIILYYNKDRKRDRQHTTPRKEAEEMNAQKEIKTKYFNEVCYMYKFLEENKQYKIVKYNFTFAYGYCLYYAEK